MSTRQAGIRQGWPGNQASTGRGQTRRTAEHPVRRKPVDGPPAAEMQMSDRRCACWGAAGKKALQAHKRNYRLCRCGPICLLTGDTSPAQPVPPEPVFCRAFSGGGGFAGACSTRWENRREEKCRMPCAGAGMRQEGTAFRGRFFCAPVRIRQPLPEAWRRTRAGEPPYRRAGKGGRTPGICPPHIGRPRPESARRFPHPDRVRSIVFPYY